MENTIDRKAYRRNSYDNYARVEKIETKRSDNLFLSKIINSMLLLLFVLMLKFFYFEEEFNLLKETFNSGYSYEIIENKVTQKINGFIKPDDINIDESKDTENINILIENETAISGENEFISAVEGVNQLLVDSEIIKNNYEIKSPLEGVITSEFGCRVSNNPIVSSYHTGLDIAASSGTKIVAAHAGKVKMAGENGSYGKCVIIESGDLTTLYAHCLEVLVKEGEVVDVGKNIAKVGMTGNATGPHLHFEIKFQERVVNPKDVIKFGEE